MPHYIPKGTYQIQLQEGDAADVRFVVPDEISMTARSAKMQIRKDAQSKLIKELATGGSGIVKSGQTLICSFVPEDFKGKAGTYMWELEVFTVSTDVITIGRGTVVINPEITR